MLVLENFKQLDWEVEYKKSLWGLSETVYNLKTNLFCARHTELRTTNGVLVYGDLAFPIPRQKHTQKISVTSSFIHFLLYHSYGMDAQRLGVFSISIPSHFLSKYFNSADLLKIKDRINNINYESATELIDSKLITSILALRDCKKSGYLRRLTFESIFLNVTVHLHTILLTSDQNKSSVNKKDEEKINQAKEYIIDNFSGDCSLNHISQIVGTNTCSLKKGFKSLYGTTVHNFVHEVRMISAQRMLAEEGLSVSEVALSVGYKNPQHFTVAYKKRFGVVPSWTKMVR